MKNVLISNLNKKDVQHFTSNLGLFIRRKIDKPFKKACNIFTNVNIIRNKNLPQMTDEEYFNQLSNEKIPLSSYDLSEKKHNIILERYPVLSEEPYIFVCNHTCPEDIETVLNIIDRNAYLVLGSIESLKYNPEMYLTWLNGMIPFDILDSEERKDVIKKMERVLKTNSILIFPEGSHNYSPNKLVNNLFDGPVNLSLKTGRKIVVISLIRDSKNNVSYIDVSNPISASDLDLEATELKEHLTEKEYVKLLSKSLRNKMATAVYHIIARHIEPIVRKEGTDIEHQIRQEKVEDAFKKLKWKRDVFDAEYLVKQTSEEKEHEEVIRTLSNLKLNLDVLLNTKINHREYVIKERDLDEKDVVQAMRRYYIKREAEKQEKRLLKRK